MGIFQNNLMGAAAAAASAGGGDFYTYQIPYSARFDGSTSTIIKTWGADPTSTTKKTISVWLKRSLVGNATAQRIITAGAGSTGSYYLSGSLTDGFAYYAGTGSFNGYTTARVFRDPSAWFHFVAIFDSGQSNDYDRIKFYFNGELYPLNNGDWTFYGGYPNTAGPELGANGYANYIGVYVGGSGHFKGYMADFIQIDGTAAISDFGETKNGVWIPKDPSGLTFGNNGYWLDFAASGDFGNDVSGNNNDWTAAGLSTHDQMLDTPTFNSDSNGGNFATLNLLSAGSYNTLSEGNLRNTGNTGTSINGAPATIGARSGQWYWEVRITTMNESHPTVGISAGSLSNATNTTTGDVANLLKYTGGTGGLVQMSMTNDVWGTYGETETGVLGFSDGDICMLALDIDNKKIWYGKNGTWFNSGDPAAGSNPQQTWTGTGFDIFPVVGSYATNTVAEANFGSDGTFNGTETAQGNADSTGYGNFYYAPPTDFLALCSGNLPTAAAVDPAQTDDDYPQKLFAPKLYTGDGATTLTISGMDLQPDLTWIKNRDATDRHCLFDSTRGVTKLLSSDSGDAQTTDADTLKSWTSDGYTVGADVKVNTSGEDYASWNWRVNGGTTAANSVGGTASVTQVDPSGAFSIVTYTTDISGSSGTGTIGHGMSIIPQIVIHKALAAAGGWWTQSVYTTNADTWMEFNGTRAQTSLTGYGAMVRPTASVFSINGIDGVGGNGRDYIAWCFANVEGYCKAGSYEGNGNADGSFVYTGFRPALIITKSIDSTSNWQIFDDKRLGFNDDNNELWANVATAEATTDMIDILSNGFKLRIATDPNVAETYIYLAMAHNPFQYATAR